MYYVYSYRDPITNDLKYIGKGKNDRLNSHWRIRKFHYNKLMQEYLTELDNLGLRPIIEKIEENLSNYDAFILESKLIERYGRLNFDKNGILLNRSNGFDFVVGTDLKKLLNSKHFNSKLISIDEKALITKLYLEGLSLHKLAKQFSHGPYTIKNIIVDSNISIRSRGGQLGKSNGMFGKRREFNSYFLGKTHSIESLEKISNSGKKLTVINGVQYKSREDARSTLGISYSTLRQRLIADKRENFNLIYEQKNNFSRQSRKRQGFPSQKI